MQFAEVIEALRDERVLRAMELSARDRQIGRAFRQQRRQGAKVEAVVGKLAEEYFLSREHIRSIVYRKKRGALRESHS